MIEPNGELVLGLVAPLGTDLGKVEAVIEKRLDRYTYSYRPVKLSGLLTRFALDTEAPANTPGGQMSHKMNLGNAFRRATARGDALALAAIGEIRRLRGSPDDAVGEPSPRSMFVLNQLKRPEEVATLREVYGGGFFLLGVSASFKKRKSFLKNGRGVEDQEAEDLIRRDEEEEDTEHGQQVGRTFHLADAFVSLDEEEHENALWRFIDLVFGHPFHTPTRDEHAMFMAFAASLRSADLSRQVGAVVVTKDGDILGSGANDVPRVGGGQYWPDDDPFDESERKDKRDWSRGYDANVKQRERILVEIARAIPLVGEDATDQQALKASSEKLSNTSLFDLTEFSRAVHAEMAAITSCARVGVSCREALLFCTTFPCHNCTKHIVAAGIGEVIYIEPYPKSKATELHDDSVEVPGIVQGNAQNMVRFRPFVGVAPRRFVDLFAMAHGTGRVLKRKDAKTGLAVAVELSTASPRVPMPATSYLARELFALRYLDLNVSDADGGANDAEEG